MHFKYDRSGRSSGIAIIFFETSTEATRAKNQFDGILAKGNEHLFLIIVVALIDTLAGQPMKIAYDTERPSRNARTGSAPPSLLNRIQKPPLADRLSRDDISIKTPTGP